MSVSIAAAWPLITQLDGSPNQYNDCGETSLCMIERYLYGPDPLLVSPDTVRRRILGDAGMGYSQLSQLSAYLAAREIPNHYWVGHGIGSVADRRAFAAALTLGRPNIALYFWDIAAQAGGHFCNVVGDDDAGTTQRANPWTDAIETNDAAWWARAYQGCGLIVDTDPATFRRAMGLLPAAPAAGLPAPSPVVEPAPAAPPRYRVLAHGALHARPNDMAPITCHVERGWEVRAVAGDSTPWISVKTLDGRWGWDKRSNLERIS